jgi:hypothetical protein
MKYLKKFNEELSPATYRKAAKSLTSLGHAKRAADINAWADLSKEREDARKEKAIIDLYSKHGVFKIDIGTKVSGNFYLWLVFDESSNLENWEYWEEDGRFDGMSLWMIMDICLYPADEETLEKCKDIDFYPGRPYYASNFQIKMSDAVGVERGGTERDEDLPYESGQWELALTGKGNVSYIEGNEYNINFANRIEANKFRKLVMDVFEGSIEMGATSQNPGGVKERIMDFYCNKKGVTIEEFDNVVDSLRRISVNNLYKD